MQRTLILFLSLFLLNATAFADTATFHIGDFPQEDTYASNGMYNANGFDDSNSWQFFGAAGYTTYTAYWRWALTIPQGSTINHAYVRIRSSLANSGSLNAAFRALLTDNKWETLGGFNRVNYPNGAALNSIPRQGDAVPWNNIPNWTLGTWYQGPDITGLVQARIDNLDYDPLDIEDKYFGLVLSYVSGTSYRAGTQEKANNSYTAELVVDWTPGAGPPPTSDSATFLIANANQEDAYASTGANNSNVFAHSNGFLYFGCSGSSSPSYYNSYWRWALTIPKGSTITKARLRIRSDNSNGGALFNAALRALVADNKWETVNGFNTTNYPNGTALNNIPRQGIEVPWNNVPSWVIETWYEAPDITGLVQARIDSPDYDPENIENRYFGLVLYYVSGTGYRTGTQEPDNDAYTAQLYVKWEKVKINSCPTADAGPDKTADLGETVQLDGSLSSDVDGDPLAYTWSLVSKPLGSCAALSDPTASIPTFTADFPGDYVVELTVNDGECDSEADTCTVTASASAFCCPKGQGFWKKHPEAWPIGALTIGSQTYTKVELQALFSMPTRGDASVILARQLIAAQLNLANGSDPSSIQDTISSAYTLLGTFAGKLPYNIKPSVPEGGDMVTEASLLESYNNGFLTTDCEP